MDERRDGGSIQEAIRRSRRRFAEAGAFDSAALVRSERDERWRAEAPSRAARVTRATGRLTGTSPTAG